MDLTSVAYYWNPPSGIRCGQLVLSLREETKSLADKIDNNPTLKDAWKQFNEIYMVIEGKELVFKKVVENE